MNNLKRLAIITLFAILATACAPQKPIPGGGKQPQAPKNATQTINNLLVQAQTAAPLKAAQLKLQAAKLMLLQKKYSQANLLLDEINTASLPDNLKFKIAMVNASAAMQMGDANKAQQYLSNLPSDNGFSKEQLREKYLLSASILGQLNQLDKEVVALITASEHTSNSNELNPLNENIWQVFKALDLHQLKQLDANTSNSYTLRGWLALMVSFKETPHSEKILSNEWYKRWRAHSAARFQPQELAQYLSKEPLKNTSYSYNHVMVALPASGKYAKGAAAILKGIKLAAGAAKHNQVKISYIDTAVHNSATAILQQATLLNADAVIGPIDRNIVSQFAQMTALPLPVLALNTAAIANSNLYQFSLGNEDEVRDAAQRAFNDGKRSMLVLVPEGSQGDIAANAFLNTFNSLGGQVADITYYNTSTGNVTQSIAQMLRLNQGAIRGLQKKVKTAYLRGAIRRMTRKDADGIFLFSNTLDAYQIGPSIHYFYADNIPLYATSKIYRGKPNPVKDIDLNGMMFGDLPWVLAPTSNKQTMAVNNSNTQGRIGRLYAFGIDAFNLAPNLYNLATQPESKQTGDTGSISISEENIINKTLPWAKFVNGEPVLLPAQ
jgi:outer membrane PBP1 activator LpoA protein